MNKHLLKRSMGLALALMLVLSALPITAMATEAPAFTTVDLVATDVTLDETNFEYTGNEIMPNVTVRAGGTLLTLDKHYQLKYENNVNVGTAKVVVTGIATACYSGTVEVPFYINEKAPEEPAFTLVEIKDTDVVIEATEFPYMGEPIEPAVTVTVEGKTLTAGKGYAVEYVNNLVPGTGTVIVRGIATVSDIGGYTGEVQVRFTIVPMTEETYPLVEIKGTDVSIAGTKFPYTGKAIEPKITVTVGGKVLTAGKDYSLKYVNNVNVGTATAIVSGIATATEFGGYTGEVKIDFTIEEAPKAPEYKITKGSGAKWYQESTKNLTFTANGDYADFIGVSIDGKRLEDSYYSVKEGSTVVTLKNSFLKKLDLGKYTITIHFTDGEAEGTFKVADGLDTTNPSTGDAGIHLWVGMLFVCLTGLAGATYAFRKKIF